ncbi:putative transcription factor bHLH family [Medicago truncatula]|uniref:Helix loop helix DNA-binding domain protein n=1 Tax=Medicago truncatula TaxID=3880 RepID=G7JFN8_MEDTR|nr:transcription factor bHLH18 [Medicago truncatula]AES86497.2 helix loop helix DNA-binding domain protein [Medicago truncatula]RHN58469.1 putative transcription factor bHLH family [Medicago truncatula]
MEESWENFHLDMELDCGDDYFIDDCNNLNIDGDDFIREILLQTPEGLISSESDHSFFHVQTDTVTVNVNGGVEVVGNTVKSKSSNSIVSQQHQPQEQEQQHGLKSKKVPRKSSSPKTYILSFDNSTMIPATPEPCVNLSSRNKRSRESTQKAEVKTNQQINGVKKGRSSSQCIDHIMAERKRRQELSEKFIALSATIPGLSKMDKASLLREAIDYVKQLKEHVEELEKQDKNVGVTPVMVLRQPYSCGINEYTNSGETSCGDDCNHHILPDIEARVIGKEVLIEIHCEKQNGIELKLLNHIENLQLFVTGSSVLPFGKSAISITIIARMGDECIVTMNDLVKSIRQVLLKP